MIPVLALSAGDAAVQSVRMGNAHRCFFPISPRKPEALASGAWRMPELRTTASLPSSDKQTVFVVAEYVWTRNTFFLGLPQCLGILGRMPAVSQVRFSAKHLSSQERPSADSTQRWLEAMGAGAAASLSTSPCCG